MSAMKYLIAIAFISLTIGSTSYAMDGCGRGFFYNGYRCVPFEAPVYRRYRRPPPVYVEPEPPPPSGPVIVLPGLRFNFH